jgi:hypothetical protein
MLGGEFALLSDCIPPWARTLLCFPPVPGQINEKVASRRQFSSDTSNWIYWKCGEQLEEKHFRNNRTGCVFSVFSTHNWK